MSHRDRPPAYGTERCSLKSRAGLLVIERSVFIDEGTTSWYDEAKHDWVTWRGSWKRVDELGEFETREAAREFMLTRSSSATEDLERLVDVIREGLARIKPMIRRGDLEGATEAVEALRRLTTVDLVVRAEAQETVHAG